MTPEHTHHQSNLNRVMKGVETQEAEKLRTAWSELNQVSEKEAWSPSDKGALFARIESTIEQNEGRHARFGLFRVPLKAVSIAASIVLLVAFWWAWTPKTIEALPGEKATHVFPDGSTLVLNSASTVRYKTWPFWDRHIQLVGEGFFDVSHDLGHFSVATSNALVTVLGTAFNVRGPRPHDIASTEITVTEGIVRIQTNNRGPSREVEAGFFSQIYVGENQATQPVQVDSRNNLEWLMGDLVFRNSTFENAVYESARRLGFEIVDIPPEFADISVTLAFRAPLTAEAVLDGLTMPLGLYHRKTANGIEIFK